MHNNTDMVMIFIALCIAIGVIVYMTFNTSILTEVKKIEDILSPDNSILFDIPEQDEEEEEVLLTYENEEEEEEEEEVVVAPAPVPGAKKQPGVVQPSVKTINNAVRTLNKKNNSGVLPSTSNYQDLVKNKFIRFNSNTNSWQTTNKSKELMGKPTSTGPKPTSKVVTQAIQTLNKRNSSGILPPTSNYKELQSSGLIKFNPSTNAWQPTQKALLSSAKSTNNNYITKFVSQNPINVNQLSGDKMNTLLNYLSQGYSNVSSNIQTLDKRIDKAISTLNVKNSSGVLPPTSTYQDLVQYNLIRFDPLTNKWSETPKSQLLSYSINNNMNNRFGPQLSQQAIDRMNNGIRTLNAKNSSGILPQDSSYKDLLDNGFIKFNKTTNSWQTTNKGKVASGKVLKVNAPDIPSDRIAKAISTLNTVNKSGNLPTDSAYRDLVQNDYIRFNPQTGTWQTTSKTKAFQRVDKAVSTLNKKNSSGVLPPDSTYIDLVQNGLIRFDPNTNAWKETDLIKNLNQLRVNNNLITPNSLKTDINNYLYSVGLTQNSPILNTVSNKVYNDLYEFTNAIYGEMNPMDYQNMISNISNAYIMIENN